MNIIAKKPLISKIKSFKTPKTKGFSSSKTFSLGADPELMILDIDKNQIVSSIPILKTDKNNPIDLGKGIKIYSDNVLLEMSFPPSDSKLEFINRLGDVLHKTTKYLGEKYKLMAKSAHIYSEEELTYSHNINPMEIGCNPSFNAWKLEVNLINEFPGGLRTGSFHLHFGNKILKDFETKINAVRLLDIFLGCASVIFDKDETGLARRKLYGKSAEYREPAYGIEYRVLSPYSLQCPKLVELCLDIANYALEQIPNAKNIICAEVASKTQTAINNCDKKLAEEVLNYVKFPYFDRIKQNYSVDLYKNWNI